MRWHFTIAWVAVGLIMAGSAAADYPERVARIVVPGTSGSPSDVFARTMADHLSKLWGQSVIVDNRPGTGVIAADVVAKATPDGYTILLMNGATAINASLLAKLPYDTLNDLIPVTQINATAFALIVPVNSSDHSVKDLIARAKANPGKLNYASSGIGSSLHLCAELFTLNAGVRVVHVPYKGAAQPYADMVSGQIDMMFLGTTTVVGLIKNGMMRALAVTSLQRSKVLPEIPTLQELGMKGFNVTAWNGFGVPAKTPRPIVTKIHADAVRVIKSPDYVKFLASSGSEAIGNSTEEFNAFFLQEVATWAKVISSAGIKAE